jgi:transcriptional regulator with XRE-family HTH domain
VRELTGHSTDSAAAALGWSQSKVSRIETAVTSVTPRDVRALLELYGAPSDEIADLLILTEEAREPPRWWQEHKDLRVEDYRGYVSLEAEAARIRGFHSDVVPSLLQIEPYAREILAQDPLKVVPYEVEQALKLRMARQSRLSGDDRIDLDVVIDEGGLRRAFGGQAVMHAQLRHIVGEARRPNVTVRVLPFSAGPHPATGGAFTVLQFPDELDPVIVCTDTLTSTQCREEPREVGVYMLVFERLVEKALSPDESISFVEQIAKESEP